MDMRKILAAALSLTMVCTAATTFGYAPTAAYAADAVAEEPAAPTEDETVTYPIEAEVDGCQYSVYEDYAVFVKCPDNTLKGDYVVPAEVNGVPVTQLYGRVFGFQKELVSVTIPATVTKIGDHLSGYSTLEKYIVDKDNPSFCSVDGVIYTKDMATLVAYPSAKPETAFTVPDGVTKIGYGAFYTANITELKLADSVKEVDSFAFVNCRALEKAELGSSVETLGYHSFWGSEALKSIELPASVSELKGNVFEGCKSLASLTVMNPDCTFTDNEKTLGVKGTTVIRSYEGSTAQAYAEKYEFQFESIGEAPVSTQLVETADVKYGTADPIVKVIDGKPYDVKIFGLFSAEGKKALDETADAEKIEEIKSGIVASLTRAVTDVDFTAEPYFYAAAIPFIKEKAVGWYNDNYAATTGYKLTSLSIGNMTVTEQAASVVTETATATAPETTTTEAATASSSETTTATTTSPDPYNPLYVGDWHLQTTGTLPYDLASIDATVSSGGSGSVTLVYTDGAHAIYGMTWKSDGNNVTVTVDGGTYSAQYNSSTDSARVSVGGAELLFARGKSVQTTSSAETSATTTSSAAETTTTTASTTATAATSTVASTTAPETTTTKSDAEQIVGEWKVSGITDKDGNTSNDVDGMVLDFLFKEDGTGIFTSKSDENSEATEDTPFNWEIKDGYVVTVNTNNKDDIVSLKIESSELLTHESDEGFTLSFTRDGSKLGDVDGDGSVSAKDASAVLVEYSKLSTGADQTFTETQKKAADVNGDGKTDAKDASAILTYYSYLSTGGTDSFEAFLKH
ncbi:MAG: leucine-rich repeat protein [Ruminococcus sp.]|nr:leucine-rich repeat protein [Ruminococcus sp.]